MKVCLKNQGTTFEGAAFELVRKINASLAKTGGCQAVARGKEYSAKSYE
jgi:hypothetical protein